MRRVGKDPKHLIAFIMAVVAPGLGRVLIDSAWRGLALFLVLLILLTISFTPRWLNIAFKIAVWILFAAMDLHLVKRSSESE